MTPLSINKTYLNKNYHIYIYTHIYMYIHTHTHIHTYTEFIKYIMYYNMKHIKQIVPLPVIDLWKMV